MAVRAGLSATVALGKLADTNCQYVYDDKVIRFVTAELREAVGVEESVHASREHFSRDSCKEKRTNWCGNRIVGVYVQYRNVSRGCAVVKLVFPERFVERNAADYNPLLFLSKRVTRKYWWILFRGSAIACARLLAILPRATTCTRKHVKDFENSKTSWGIVVPSLVPARLLTKATWTTSGA